MLLLVQDTLAETLFIYVDCMVAMEDLSAMGNEMAATKGSVGTKVT